MQSDRTHTGLVFLFEDPLHFIKVTINVDINHHLVFFSCYIHVYVYIYTRVTIFKEFIIGYI